MESNEDEAVLILNVSPDGKKTYTLQSDPTKRYVVNERGELVEIDNNYENVKLESPDIDLHSASSDNNSNQIGDADDDSLFAQLEDRNLRPLNLIDHTIVPEFNDDSLAGDMENVDFEMESEAIAQNVSRKNKSIDDDIEDDEEPDDILVMHMDIRDPLSTLRTNLEQRLGVSLHDYSFWLQDSSQLESHKNLVDQCVSGEGLVQVNVQIRTDFKIINIVDVLKPADEYVDLMDETDSSNNYNDIQEHLYHYTQNQQNETETTNPTLPTTPQQESQAQMIKRWTIDNQFKRDQQRLNIPANPNDWTEIHVRHWLQWAVRQFSLIRIKLSDWVMTGQQLCNLTLSEFQEKVPEDPNDIFWTHLELLKKCKLVAVLQTEPSDEYPAPKFKTKPNRTSKLLGNVSLSMVEASGYNCGNRTGNNGQIQLWQFLLELLTDQNKRHVINWVGNEGEFKLNSPEVVAQLWGERKNKPTMNYEKLSRALRYYYDGDMISKVPGKRFVYKFVCDLKQLIGYDAAQLSLLVNSCDKTWRKMAIN